MGRRGATFPAPPPADHFTGRETCLVILSRELSNTSFSCDCFLDSAERIVLSAAFFSRRSPKLDCFETPGTKSGRKHQGEYPDQSRRHIRLAVKTKNETKQKELPRYHCCDHSVGPNDCKDSHAGEPGACFPGEMLKFATCHVCRLISTLVKRVKDPLEKKLWNKLPRTMRAKALRPPPLRVP